VSDEHERMWAEMMAEGAIKRATPASSARLEQAVSDDPAMGPIDYLKAQSVNVQSDLGMDVTPEMRARFQEATGQPFLDDAALARLPPDQRERAIRLQQSIPTGLARGAKDMALGIPKLLFEGGRAAYEGRAMDFAAKLADGAAAQATMLVSDPLRYATEDPFGVALGGYGAATKPLRMAGKSMADAAVDVVARKAPNVADAFFPAATASPKINESVRHSRMFQTDPNSLRSTVAPHARVYADLPGGGRVTTVAEMERSFGDVMAKLPESTPKGTQFTTYAYSSHLGFSPLKSVEVNGVVLVRNPPGSMASKMGIPEGAWVSRGDFRQMETLGATKSDGILGFTAKASAFMKRMAVIGNPPSHLNALVGEAVQHLAHGGDPTAGVRGIVQVNNAFNNAMSGVMRTGDDALYQLAMSKGLSLGGSMDDVINSTSVQRALSSGAMGDIAGALKLKKRDADMVAKAIAKTAEDWMEQSSKEATSKLGALRSLSDALNPKPVPRGFDIPQADPMAAAASARQLRGKITAYDKKMGIRPKRSQPAQADAPGPVQQFGDVMPQPSGTPPPSAAITTFIEQVKAGLDKAAPPGTAKHAANKSKLDAFINGVERVGLAGGAAAGLWAVREAGNRWAYIKKSVMANAPKDVVAAWDKNPKKVNDWLRSEQGAKAFMAGADEALTWALDYKEIPGWAMFMRDSAFVPFISYGVKATGMTAGVLLDRPGFALASQQAGRLERSASAQPEYEAQAYGMPQERGKMAFLGPDKMKNLGSVTPFVLPDEQIADIFGTDGRFGSASMIPGVINTIQGKDNYGNDLPDDIAWMKQVLSTVFPEYVGVMFDIGATAVRGNQPVAPRAGRPLTAGEKMLGAATGIRTAKPDAIVRQGTNQAVGGIRQAKKNFVQGKTTADNFNTELRDTQKELDKKRGRPSSPF
jgi:hypothetical protein